MTDSSFWSNQFNSALGDLLGSRVRQRSQSQLLKEFFPQDIAELISSIPENQRWGAIQQLAPEFGLESQQQPMQQQQGNIYPEVAEQAAKRPEIKSPAPTKPPIRAGINRLGRAFSKSETKQLTADQEKELNGALDLYDLMEQMDAEWKTNKVLSGGGGVWALRARPLGIKLNQESDTFDAIGTEAALLAAGLGGKGPVTKARQDAEMRSKPGLTQNKITQKKRIEHYKKKALSIINRYRNAGYGIDRIAQSLKDERDQEFNLSELPDPSTVSPNARAEGSNGKFYKIDNNSRQWVPDTGR